MHTLSEVLTAFALLIPSLISLATYIQTRRTQSGIDLNATAIERNQSGIDRVHALVNGQSTKLEQLYQEKGDARVAVAIAEGESRASEIRAIQAEKDGEHLP